MNTLHKVKKVHETHEIDTVNMLLEEGWVLIHVIESKETKFLLGKKMYEGVSSGGLITKEGIKCKCPDTKD